jgi:hypothetical protein
LKEYGIVGALDEADLLLYQVDKWAEEMKRHVPANRSRRGKRAGNAVGHDGGEEHSVGGDIRGGAKGELGEGEGHHSNAFTSIADAVHKEHQAEKAKGLGGASAPGTADTSATSKREASHGRPKKIRGRGAVDMDGMKAGGNAMMSQGASPYYESDVAIERHKKLSKRLSYYWKKDLNRNRVSVTEERGL